MPHRHATLRITDTVDTPAHAADQELARLARGLGHPLRVAILRRLCDEGACVCGELVEAIPRAQSTVSQHLKILQEAGLVQGQVDGPRVCYCAAPGAGARLGDLIGELTGCASR